MTQPKPNQPDTKTALVKVLRRIAGELGSESMTSTEFVRRSGVTTHRIKRLFGTYNRLVEAAGLVPRSFPKPLDSNYSTADIVAEIVRVLRIRKSKLTTTFFQEHSRTPLSVCRRRFGGWRGGFHGWRGVFLSRARL